VRGRGQHDAHAVAHHRRAAFHDADAGKVVLNGHEDLLTEVAVLVLAAAEHHGDAHLVVLLQEFLDVADLRVQVGAGDARVQADLFEHAGLLLFAVVALLLFLLVKVLIEIHHLADRRVGLRRDLYEVQVGAAGHVDGLDERLDAQHGPVHVDEADLRGRDIAVDANSLVVVQNSSSCDLGRQSRLTGFRSRILYSTLF